MKKPVNEAILQIAIAQAQVEFYHELRTGTLPPVKDVLVGLQRLEYFGKLVGEAYDYYDEMRGGIDSIIDRDYHGLVDDL